MGFLIQDPVGVGMLTPLLMIMLVQIVNMFREFSSKAMSMAVLMDMSVLMGAMDVVMVVRMMTTTVGGVRRQTPD